MVLSALASFGCGAAPPATENAGALLSSKPPSSNSGLKVEKTAVAGVLSATLNNHNGTSSQTLQEKFQELLAEYCGGPFTLFKDSLLIVYFERDNAPQPQISAQFRCEER
jgi:hypothetical protein